jgi:hypothetical protein
VENTVRRLLSIAIMLLMSFQLIAPAFGQTPQAHLLLCCRHNGAHHCMTITYTEIPMVHQHCPASQGAATAAHASAWMIGSSHAASAADVVEKLKVRQVEAGYRISFHRSRQKRGPPVLFS